jgi:hypothetical protein
MTLRSARLDEVRPLFEKHHGYRSAGGTATYCYAVEEHGALVAAYTWQPPPLGVAKAVSPEAPYGVLSLSRMVAVPRAERELRHISKPLRVQMRTLIDRSRWPVLVTFSDEGQGHTGHVYKCSGWQKTARAQRPVYEDDTGARASRYANGVTNPTARALVRVEDTWLQRWEHWICDRGLAAAWMERCGWRREPRPGRTWRSGAQAYRWVHST